MKIQSFIQYTALATVIAVVSGCEQQESFQPRRTDDGADARDAVLRASAAPSFIAFSPKKGIPNSTIVTINGTGFSNNPFNNTVYFDGIQASVIDATTSKLTVRVPMNATSGEIVVYVFNQEAGFTSSTVAYFEVLDIPFLSLEAFYPFDGNAKDLGRNLLHGSVSGATLTTDRFGNSSRAYSFDGLDDYIGAGNPTALQITNAITFSVWVKNPVFTNNANILSKVACTNSSCTEGHGYQLDLALNANGAQYYSASIKYPGYGTTGNNFSFGAPFVLNTWVNFTFTLDGQNAKWYKDGVQTFSVTNQQPLTAAALGNFEIGRYSGGGFQFNGLIDDVAVYSRALTAAEVLKLYQQNIRP